MRYTQVVLEGDTKGRASISALDEDGAGHGHRLAGPKYIGDTVSGNYARATFRVELKDDDVEALHSYLRIWDGIHLSDGAPEWAALVAASDRYRQATNLLARVSAYPDFPVKRLGEITAQRSQAWSRLLAAAAKLGGLASDV